MFTAIREIDMASNSQLVVTVIFTAIISSIAGAVANAIADDDPPNQYEVQYQREQAAELLADETALAATTGFVRGVCLGNTQEGADCELRIRATARLGERLGDFRVIGDRTFDALTGEGAFLPGVCTGVGEETIGNCSIVSLTVTENLEPPPHRFGGS